MWSPKGYGDSQGWYKTTTGGGGGLGLQTNLSAFFELDNSLADSTGNVTNLTNNNGVTFTTDTPGATGQQCAVFASASSQFLSHANDAHLIINSADFSFFYWIKPVNSATGDIMNCSTTAFPQQGWGGGSVFDGTKNVYNAIMVNNNGATGEARWTSTVVAATWVLVVVAFDAATKTPSISVSNGTYSAGTTMALLPSGETGVFNIGTDAGHSGFIDARICRAGIYQGRKLSQTDVGLLWNGGSGLTYAQML